MREIAVKGNPREGAIWNQWLLEWGDGNHAKRSEYIDSYDNAAFITKHWHGGVRSSAGRTKNWQCDKFNQATRLCEAHEDRPPVCSDYPWYGGKPKPLDIAHCSFWADLPSENRPPEWVAVKIGKL